MCRSAVCHFLGFLTGWKALSGKQDAVIPVKGAMRGSEYGSSVPGRDGDDVCMYMPASLGARQTANIRRAAPPARSPQSALPFIHDGNIKGPFDLAADFSPSETNRHSSGFLFFLLLLLPLPLLLLVLLPATRFRAAAHWEF